MATKSNFQRFRDGVLVSGVSLNIHQKGQVLYVCNASTTSPYGIGGSDGNDGKSPEKPLATIKGALALCVAGRGDKIIVLAGHSETVSAAGGLTLNVAGVEIIGDPSVVGADRPTITLNTANTATIVVSAANMSISNFLFIGNFLAIATCIDVTAAKDFNCNNCEFRDASSVLGFVKAIRTDVTSNDCDGLQVISCQYFGLGTNATTSLVNTRGVMDRLQVRDCLVDIQGTTATTGALVLSTSKALTHAQIVNNIVLSPITTSAAGCLAVVSSGSTGIVTGNYVYAAAASTAILITTGSGLACGANTITRSAVDTSGLLLPVASS